MLCFFAKSSKCNLRRLAFVQVWLFISYTRIGLPDQKLNISICIILSFKNVFAEPLLHGVSWTLIFGGLSRGGARILVRGGNIKQNFIHEFLSRFVLQWLRHNFGSGETFSKNLLIKDF